MPGAGRDSAGQYTRGGGFQQGRSCSACRSHGQVTSRLIVEKAETLDLLRRDAPQLERALQDAGLKTSGNGLQFSLQQQMSQQRDDQPSGQVATAQMLVADETAATDIAARSYSSLAAARGGIDIRV